MPKNTTLVRSLPGPVLGALKEQGTRIGIARKRRQQTQDDLAQRMNVDVRTLRRVEAGDPRVTLGAYMAALWALGLLKQLDRVAAPALDAQGQALSLQELPKRVRRTRETF